MPSIWTVDAVESMSFLESKYAQSGELVGYLIPKCPGCGNSHFLVTNENKAVINAKGKKNLWNFDGNMERPTFKPSVLIGRDDYVSCHFTLTDGVFAFQNDSPEEFRNKRLHYSGEQVTSF